MRVSYNWLREHIALDISPEDLASVLRSLGFEVTSITKSENQITQQQVDKNG